MQAYKDGKKTFCGAQISYLHHEELVTPVVKRAVEKIAYYRISAHYKFIMKTMFDCFKYPKLIILEVMLCFPPQRSTTTFITASVWPIQQLSLQWMCKSSSLRMLREFISA